MNSFKRTKYDRFKAKAYKLGLDLIKSLFVNLFIWQLVYSVLASFIASTLFNWDEIEAKSYSWTSTTFAALKLAFIVLYSHAISWHLYEIYMTESYYFEIKPRNVNQLSLGAAMSLNSHPYIQVIIILIQNILAINEVLS